MLTMYSFRAECMVDVTSFRREVFKAGIATTSIVHLDKDGHPDVTVEMLATESDITRFRDIAREVEDGHVIVQTLRPCPLSENSLKRDADVNP